jgi:enamine deaminase RidA (YjgF/YER057c/UK114 family)
MDKKQVNPWTWQDAYGFSQAWRIDGGSSMVFVSGQGPLNGSGEVVGEDDFEAQTRQTFENLRTVLEQAGATFADVVKIGVYLTDFARVADFGRIKADYITGAQPASTALGVAALAVDDARGRSDCCSLALTGGRQRRSDPCGRDVPDLRPAVAPPPAGRRNAG